MSPAEQVAVGLEAILKAVLLVHGETAIDLSLLEAVEHRGLAVTLSDDGGYLLRVA